MEKFIPKNAKIGKVNLLCIAAHQDDVEIMAADGIVKAVKDKDTAFHACIVTDGSGSARAGKYANFTDAEMMKIRKSEQKEAAEIGHYSNLFLMDFPSSAVKNPNETGVINQLEELILQIKPQVIYTHNLCDKHDTHIGVVTKVLEAVRKIPKESRPQKIYGCEVWRDLDWLCDDEKVLFDLSGYEELCLKLLTVFDSQIAGGKRYDLATAGRRLANATFCSSHTVDKCTAATYAQDLSVLMDSNTNIVEFAMGTIKRFEKDVYNRLVKNIGSK